MLIRACCAARVAIVGIVLIEGGKYNTHKILTRYIQETSVDEDQFTLIICARDPEQPLGINQI